MQNRVEAESADEGLRLLSWSVGRSLCVGGCAGGAGAGAGVDSKSGDTKEGGKTPTTPDPGEKQGDGKDEQWLAAKKKSLITSHVVFCFFPINVLGKLFSSNHDAGRLIYLRKNDRVNGVPADTLIQVWAN